MKRLFSAPDFFKKAVAIKKIPVLFQDGYNIDSRKA